MNRKRPLFLVFLISCFCSDLLAVTRMGIISDSFYYGEREVGFRIKLAAESLGWQVFLDEDRGRRLEKVKRLDWTICLLPGNPFTRSDCANYMAIFHPFDYFDQDRRLLPFYEKYDGYLLTVKPDLFDCRLESGNKKTFSIPFYPTVQRVEYQKLAFNHLVTILPVWGNRRNSEKFKGVYRLLSQTDFARFYGVLADPTVIPNGYMGTLPFDGVSIIQTFQKHGIVLVLHSQQHNKGEIPSARIFEAAAASAVIISDQNPFVKEHFGDSVYYVNTKLSSIEIFAQIKGHMDRIHQDPETALKMAQKSHQIFIDKFLMTDQLLRLDSMHKKMKSGEI
jgi:hypothetical protein